MTISSTTTKVSFAGNASTTVFAYSFKIFETTDLEVIIRVAATGVETVKTLTTDYSVSGAGSDSGGNVTFGSAPASGETIVIRRKVPLTQGTDYVENDTFGAENHETALDRLTIIAQQQQEEVDRTIKAPSTDTASLELPSSTARASRIMAFDASGGVTTSAVDSLSLATLQAFTDYKVTTATGNGSTAAYTLSADPGQEGNCQVFLDGVYQSKSSFSIAGSVLTFDTNIPSGVAIEVVHGTAAATYVPPANTLTYEQLLQADIDTDLTSVSGSDDTLASAKAIKTYVDASTSSASSVAADNMTIGDAAVLITTSSGNITIDAAASDSNIILKGTDGGVDTVFLTVSGADAGAATFASTVTATGLILGSTAVTSTAAELNILDGVTSTAAELNYNDTGAAVGTVVASKTVTADANKDVASLRNLTITGEIDAATGDFSGAVDIDGALDVAGTTNLDVVDIDGAVDIAATTTVSAANKVQFRDAAIYLNSSVDGQLDIVADTEIQIAATTIDINGAVDISGALTLATDLAVAQGGTGASTFAANGILYGAGTGAIAATAVGTDGNVLTSNGSGSAPTFEPPASGGAVASDDISAGDAAVLITTSSGNITIDAAASDSDIIFRGTDGGVDTLFVTIDGANGGATTFASTVTTTGLVLGSTAVTSTAAEINILDGVTTTAAEINLIDGGTSRGTTAVASGDGILINDAGTMRQTNVDTVSTYFASHNVGGTNIVTTGALNAGSITSGFGTIDTGSSTITTSGLISGGSLDIDSVLINGSTIGHTDDTDLMTVASGLLTVAGEVSMTTLDIGGTNVTSTAAELNILDGVTSTAAEINLIDGGTARGTTAVGSGDGILINDAGTMRQTNVDTVSTYFASHSVGGGNIVTTGALNSGSITSGFGSIDTGSSTITTTGLISGGSLDIDDVLINGTTIGHTDDTDLMTVANGLLTVAGEISVTTLDIGGTNVTSTAYELNILDGVTSTAAELNILDGVTSTAAELNILDGVTSTAAELNILDGVTSTAAELNILDGATVVVGEINALDIGSTAVGTAVASKAVILDSNKDYTGVRNLTLTGALTVPDGSIPIADLDIDGGTDIGAAIVDADLFIIDDGAGGANKKVTAARLKTYAGGGGSATDWEVISSTGTVSAGTYLEITGFNMVRVHAVHTAGGTAVAHSIDLSTSGSSVAGVSTQNGQWWRMSGANTPVNSTGAHSPSTSAMYFGSSDTSAEPFNIELNLYGLDETNVGIMAQEMALSSNALNRWTGQTASGSSTWFLHFNHACDTTLVVGCK